MKLRKWISTKFQAMKLQLNFITFTLAILSCIFIASFIISHSHYSKFYPLLLLHFAGPVISCHLRSVLLSSLSSVYLLFTLVASVKSLLHKYSFFSFLFPIYPKGSQYSLPPQFFFFLYN